MQVGYKMTDDSFGAKLENFKEKVDGMFTVIGKVADINWADEAKAAVKYKKVGGLHFVKVGDMSASWSFKKKPVKPVVHEPVETTPIENEADRARLAERIRKIQGV